ncbi:MAG TPA: hypothetical protein VL443_10870 [Cyclobacteriaceae bacterium]|jgi:hypothetical protein|nr:hypothetical protein [Cyclobacteriaceae bacterium]
MKQGEEMEQMLRPDGKKGVMMCKSQYEKYCNAIFDILDSDEDHTINHILEKVKLLIPDTLESEIAWHVLQVKLDLEARGLIKAVAPIYHKRTFHIKLTRPGQQRIRHNRLLNKVTQ